MPIKLEAITVEQLEPVRRQLVIEVSLPLLQTYPNPRYTLILAAERNLHANEGAYMHIINIII